MKSKIKDSSQFTNVATNYETFLWAKITGFINAHPEYPEDTKRQLRDYAKETEDALRGAVLYSIHLWDNAGFFEQLFGFFKLVGMLRKAAKRAYDLDSVWVWCTGDESRPFCTKLGQETKILLGR